jgi:hypothetical protein
MNLTLDLRVGMIGLLGSWFLVQDPLAEKEIPL